MIPLGQVDLIWIPSVHALIRSVVAATLEQRSVCLMVPPTVDLPLFRALLARQLAAGSLHVVSVPVPDRPVGELAAALADSLGIVWTRPDEPRTLARLLALAGLPDIVLLEGIELLEETARSAWIRFVEQWATASQGRAVRGLATPCVVAIVPVAIGVSLPATNVRLAVRCWWGIPSAVEVRLLCRSWSESDELGSLTAWREHVIPSLAGNDLDLARWLLDSATLPREELATQLRSYGIDRGWTTRDLQRRGAVNGMDGAPKPNGGRALGTPPKGLEALWEIGALYWTPEFGLELHSAAVALLDWQTVLERRLWRGQATLLLPLLNEARIAICRRLSAIYGPRWPVQWETPQDSRQDEAVRHDPSACEWGHLDRLFSRYDPAARLPSLRDVVIRARLARNELAHGRPLPFATYEALWQKLQPLMA